MVKKIEWGTNRKCGIINCNKQINWGEFVNSFACETHRNRKWELCEACQTKKTTHTDYYDYNGGYEAEKALKGVKEGINLQKEIIEKLFSENISASLREKLNATYEKAQETEKIIPELERLTSEYWEKKLNCASDLVREKGGQQTNIYESNLCDKCGDEVNERRRKLRNGYQVNVLNKLVVFDSETTAQIEKEIGEKEVMKIILDLSSAGINKKITKEQGATRYHFSKKLPFYRAKKDVAWHQSRQNKKAAFLKLKQYFQNHSIKQIKEIGSSNYFIIWYENGNNEKKYGSFLPVEWSNFTWNDYKGISIHEINKVLSNLDQEPTPKEEEKPVERNNKPEENKNQFSELEKELIKRYFIKNKIKKVEIVNGELVITHNNNNETINAKQITDNYEYQIIKNSLEKVNKNELTSSELGLEVETPTKTQKPVNSPSENKYLWLVGGIAVGAVFFGILFFFFQRRRNKSKKNN